jgi:hypothetical protein
MNKIYFWANNTQENSGEGILALNFLDLLKKKYKNHNFINLNKFTNQNNFFYNYILIFWGIIKIWNYFLQGNKVCYINYLPVWNFLIFCLLPKKTILGPITGTTTKKNIIYNFFKKLGIYFLKKKKTKLLFSHNQFKPYFAEKQLIYFNFLFYKFKINKKQKQKKFDLIFYYKKNNNKGNYFLIKLIKNIPLKFKIAIIGDKIKLNKKNRNINNFGKLSRNKAIKIINLSKFALTTKENHFSFFGLDSLSNGLKVFYNKDLKLFSDVKTNMFLPINFKDYNYSIKYIKNQLSKKHNRKYFKINTKNFDNYLK